MFGQVTYARRCCKARVLSVISLIFCNVISSCSLRPKENIQVNLNWANLRGSATHELGYLLLNWESTKVVVVVVVVVPGI